MKSESVLLEEYNNVLPFLEKIGIEVDSILNELCSRELSSPEKKQIGPNYRVKSAGSYIEKVLYRNKKYKNPIKDVQDKVGTRIVCLTEKDVIAICNAIKKEDRLIIKDNSQGYIKIRNNNPQSFMYMSEHYIVQLKASYLKKKKIILPHNIKKSYLSCEIQLRTLMQHAYAETSHNTVFKGEYSKNPNMLRTLATSMALIETADKKLLAIYDEVEKDSSKINCMTKKIVSFYKDLDSSFNSNEYNYTPVLEYLKYLYLIIPKYKNAKVLNIELIENFVSSKNLLLKKIIAEKKFQAFSSPLLIIILLSVDYYLSIIEQSWPLHPHILSESRRYLMK